MHDLGLAEQVAMVDQMDFLKHLVLTFGERSIGGGHGKPLQHSCLEKISRGQRSLAGHSPLGHKE